MASRAVRSRKPIENEMTAPLAPPLILFSGLAADATVFAPQKLAVPQLVVPRWIAPHADETMSAYCERFADQLQTSGPCVIGGASFGGIIALEMARYLNPLAVILVGSVRGPAELPRRMRVLRLLGNAVPLLPVSPLQWSAAAGTSAAARRILPHHAGLARQFCDADAAVFRWSVRQILSWKTTPVVTCPVYQIHGERDRVLPVRYTNPDVVVRGGGHVISLTHASQVNAFLRSCLKQIADEQSAGFREASSGIAGAAEDV